MTRISFNRVLGQVLLPGMAIGLLATPARGQAASGVSQRTDRVVVWSPHFDEPNRPYQALNCPAQPMRLFGFESPASARPAELLVRAHEYNIRRPEFTRLLAEGVLVRLLARLTDSGLVELPAALPWTARVDPAGAARLRVPPGVYEISIGVLGYGRNVGVVRVRAGRTDSLHAFVHQAPVCQPGPPGNHTSGTPQDLSP